jgi:hypothetical protein
MEKTVINRKLEIMQDIADIVRGNGEIELWRDVAALIETEEYRQCTEFAEKMNMELAVIEKKVPAEAKQIYKIRFKLAMLKGVEVFGEPSRFLQWIDKQAGAFGGEAWRSLITSEAGLQKVLYELNRISDNIGRTN